MKKLFSVALLMIVVIVGCAPQQVDPAPTSTLVQVETSPTPCAPSPVAVPTRPAETPKYADLDPTTGLHMTGIVQEIDLETYHLKVTGEVDEPLELTYDDLRCMPKVEVRCTLVCPGFFQDEATWAGVPIAEILERAEMREDATGLRLIGADGYSSFVFLKDIPQEDNMVAYEWEGEPLPILHGFPVRTVFPALEGNKWVKWLVEIEVS